MSKIEKDLFYYIFSPNSLDRERYKRISDLKVNYINELNLLKEIKDKYNLPVSEGIIAKIWQRVEKINKKSSVLLEKTNNPHIFQSGQLVLAAESPVLEQKLRTDTFQDKNSEYLVKIITDKQQNKIFIFNKDNSEMRNVKIKIEPSGKSFILESSFKPYTIIPKQEINRIAIFPDE